MIPFGVCQFYYICVLHDFSTVFSAYLSVFLNTYPFMCTISRIINCIILLRLLFRFIVLEGYAIIEPYHFTCQGRIVYAANYRDD